LSHNPLNGQKQQGENMTSLAEVTRSVLTLPEISSSSGGGMGRQGVKGTEYLHLMFITPSSISISRLSVTARKQPYSARLNPD